MMNSTSVENKEFVQVPIAEWTAIKEVLRARQFIDDGEDQDNDYEVIDVLHRMEAIEAGNNLKQSFLKERQMRILLVDKQRVEVVTLDVDDEKIVEAACIVYQDRYYIYSGQDGRFFSTVRFMQVNPPVDISNSKVV